MASHHTHPIDTTPIALTAAGLHRDTVLLHWMVALLFVLAITGILGRGALPAGDPLRPTLRSLHILVGQVIFLFAALRAYTRWRHPLPRTAPATPLARMSHWSAMGVHGLLYVVMFAQPISGVLFLQAGDKTVAFFGLALPTMVPSSPELHFQLKEFHQFMSKAFYALIALHVAGALWHHVILKDHTLRRMLTLRGAAPVQPEVAKVPDVAFAHGDVPPAFRRRMVDLVHAGHSPAQVAAAFGCSALQVSQWVAQATGERALAPQTAHSPAPPATAPVRAPAGDFSNTPTDKST